MEFHRIIYEVYYQLLKDILILIGFQNIMTLSKDGDMKNGHVLCVALKYWYELRKIWEGNEIIKPQLLPTRECIIFTPRHILTSDICETQIWVSSASSKIT